MSGLLDALEGPLRQIVREEMAAALQAAADHLAGGGPPRLVQTGIPAAPYDLSTPGQIQVRGELRRCDECGSEVTAPCGNADCGYPSGEPVVSENPHLSDELRASITAQMAGDEDDAAPLGAEPEADAGEDADDDGACMACGAGPAENHHPECPMDPATIG